jgi:hypothetical protein
MNKCKTCQAQRILIHGTRQNCVAPNCFLLVVDGVSIVVVVVAVIGDSSSRISNFVCSCIKANHAVRISCPLDKGRIQGQTWSHHIIINRQDAICWWLQQHVESFIQGVFLMSFHCHKIGSCCINIMMIMIIVIMMAIMMLLGIEL